MKPPIAALLFASTEITRARFAAFRGSSRATLRGNFLGFRPTRTLA